MILKVDFALKFLIIHQFEIYRTFNDVTSLKYFICLTQMNPNFFLHNTVFSVQLKIPLKLNF